MLIVTRIYNRLYKKETSAKFLAERYIKAEENFVKNLNKTSEVKFDAKFGLPLKQVKLIKCL
jgi:hypothetical protein